MGEKTIRALKGDESLLLILPKEVSEKLNIVHQDWLQYDIKKGKLVIRRLDGQERSTNMEVAS